MKCMIPKHSVSFDDETWKDYELCGPTSTCGLKGILRKTKTAGSDGSERTDKIKEAKMVSAAIFVMDEGTKKTVSLQMPVLGRQTVRRPELWANTWPAHEMDGDAECEADIDASHVVAGFNKLELKPMLREGGNGDLWTLFFRLIQDKNLSIDAATVNLHVGTAEDWMKYDMHHHRKVYNDMPDKCASEEANK